jgi:predicted Zn-dependent protease
MSLAEQNADVGAEAIQQAAETLNTDPAQAEARARELLARTPGDPAATLLLGAALRHQGRVVEALEILEPLLAAGAETGWMVYAELAQTFFALGHTRRAAVLLEPALELRPQWAPGWRLLGDIRLLSGDAEGAQAADSRYLQSVIRDPWLREQAEALTGGDLETTKNILAAALSQDLYSLPIAHLLAEVLVRLHRLSDAEALLAACVREAPDFDLVRLAYADLLTRMARPEAALREIDALLARTPRSLRCRILKATLSAQAGDDAGAVEAYNWLLRGAPDQPELWRACGQILQRLRRLDEAAVVFRRSVEADAGFTKGWRDLAELEGYRFTSEELVRLEALDTSPDTPAAARADLQSVLVKARADVQP